MAHTPRDHDAPSGGIAHLFDLRQDLEDAEAIDASVRAGVDVAGTNLWVLFFAILIASVGLNVNSTASIIGAMLISPLMGPIVGLGYGLAVHDVRLIRRALRNLLIFAAISLVTSTLYFTLSPLQTAGTELLARTTPTLWDVLIAFFGGAAGIIALTRRSISNVVPGVAIATALMPPLCTVGFGLSRADWGVAGGAFYLFVINGVFIAFSTFLFVKLMKLPARGEVSDRLQRHAALFTALTVLAVTLPSAYLAWRFVQAQRFLAVATVQVEQLAHDTRFVVLDREIDPATHAVRVTLSGDRREASLGPDIAARLAAQGFRNAEVVVRFSGSERVDVAGLKRELREDVFRQVRREADELRARVKGLQAENRQLHQVRADHSQLIAELHAQLPQATRVMVGTVEVAPSSADVAASGPAPLLVRIELPRAPGAEEQHRLARWLDVRESAQPIVIDYVTPRR